MEIQVQDTKYQKGMKEGQRESAKLPWYGEISEKYQENKYQDKYQKVNFQNEGHTSGEHKMI